MRLGVLRETGTNVAIKSRTRDEDTQDFWQEAESLKKLSKPGHPNVVRLVGVYNLVSDLPWLFFFFGNALFALLFVVLFVLFLFHKKKNFVAVKLICCPSLKFATQGPKSVYRSASTVQNGNNLQA